jgi:hypothetical protein
VPFQNIAKCFNGNDSTQMIQTGATKNGSWKRNARASRFAGNFKDHRRRFRQGRRG